MTADRDSILGPGELNPGRLCEGRYFLMYVKDTLLPLLQQHHISYQLYAHEALGHGDIDIELPDMKGTILKNLVLTNKNHELYLFSLPLEYRADLKGLAKALDLPRFSFASVSDLAFMGIPPGHVSPLCLFNDPGLKVNYVQPEELDNFTLVNCHPLDNHFSIDIMRSDLENLVRSSGHTITRVSGAVITG